MAPTLVNYRLYCLDANGAIVSAEWIQAEADGDAMQKAADVGHKYQCEVWKKDRLVGVVTPR